VAEEPLSSIAGLLFRQPVAANKREATKVAQNEGIWRGITAKVGRISYSCWTLRYREVLASNDASTGDRC